MFPIRRRVAQSLRCLVLLVGIVVSGQGIGAPPLQLFVEITPAGGVLRPPPGIYAGPVVIRKPITIEGGGEVTVDGEGSGTVISVEAEGSVVRGLTIVNSGDSHDQVDAGILVTADGVVIEDNTITDSLFGVHLRQVANAVVRNNRIASKPNEHTLRGDGVRLWNSTGNLIEGNAFNNIRDLVFSNSRDNRIVGNTIKDSRVAMEFVFSPGNRVIGNTVEGNLSGIIVLYSDEVEVRGNRVVHLRSRLGSALAVKGSSKARLIGNDILDCAIGLVANAPVHPEHVFHLIGNRFAYNDVAIYFYGEKGGHRVHDNRFEGNLTDVLVSASSSAFHNDWSGNYWDRYEGFDEDGDGYGDTRYDVLVYSDRIWMDRPTTRFYRGSPVMEMVDFVERLAPFSDPALILTDPRPRVR